MFVFLIFKSSLKNEILLGLCIFLFFHVVRTPFRGYCSGVTLRLKCKTHKSKSRFARFFLDATHHRKGLCPF